MAAASKPRRYVRSHSPEEAAQGSHRRRGGVAPCGARAAGEARAGGLAKAFASLLSAFLQGLNETGYAEGRSVAIKQRWAETNYPRLPALADDFPGRAPSGARARGTHVHLKSCRYFKPLAMSDLPWKSVGAGQGLMVERKRCDLRIQRLTSSAR